MSAAFGRLGGGVGGIQINDAVKRLNSLENGRDRDFAINGLAHGIVGRDPESALRWANSVSDEGFRKVVVEMSLDEFADVELIRRLKLWNHETNMPTCERLIRSRKALFPSEFSSAARRIEKPTP